MPAEINAIGLQLAQTTRAFVARSEAAINKRIDEVCALINEIPAGAEGKPGERGLAGEAGPAGKDGESIHPDNVALMIRAAVDEAIKAIPAGAEGKPGERGLAGEAGPAGKDGESIHPDTVALMIRAAVDEAIKAIAIPVATDGRDGRDGRDAAELNILPGIEPEKHYARGTWAQYAGGIVRAKRETDCIGEGQNIDLSGSGWETMVEGIAAQFAQQSDTDPREVSLVTQMTSGATVITKMQIPMILDKGIWRAGDYVKGDHVTWDGSGWIAQASTADKPGTSEAWRLSTKRGRDGKDGGTGDSPMGARAPVRLK